MASTPHRADRLRDQIRAEIAKLIGGRLRDPRIGFTTVTRVELSADFQHARVLVSVLGDSTAQQQTIEALTRATGYVRHEIGHRLRLRRVPEFVFLLDHGAEDGLRIEQLLANLHKSSDT